MKSRGPQSLDKVVGRNVRVHRLAKGMSQTDLANELGITFQQIQKYEKGTNRVGSGRLFEISVILGVSVLTLFEGGKATLAKGDDTSPFNLFGRSAVAAPGSGVLGDFGAAHAALAGRSRRIR